MEAEAKPKKRTRTRILKLALAIVVILILLVVFLLPAFVSSEKGWKTILAKINNSIDGKTVSRQQKWHRLTPLVRGCLQVFSCMQENTWNRRFQLHNWPSWPERSWKNGRIKRCRKTNQKGNPPKILLGTAWPIRDMCVLGSVLIVTVIAGGIIWNRRDLPL